MFGIDAKEIFQQKISDVIIILFAIHILAVVFTYIIKWIRPHLKYRATVYNKRKPEDKEEHSYLFGSWFRNQNAKKSYNVSGHNATDEEYVSLLGNLKAFLEIADNPSKTLIDSSNLMKIHMMSDSEFENTLILGNFLRKLSKGKCSSEAQTTISIDPAVKVKYSCPELVYDDLIQRRVIKRADSSDSFLSTCSKNSSGDLKKELEQIINELENDDEVGKEKTNEDKTMQKLQKYLKTSLEKADVADSFGRNRNSIGLSQENKVLELAISEFEKELKPIKEQIQILKQCISGFDLTSNTPNSLPSDFTSSFTGTALFSESCSGTLSTCCSSDLQSYFSSYHIISGTSFGSMETDSRYKNIQKLDKIASLNTVKNKYKSKRCHKQSSVTNRESSKTPEVSNSSDKCKSNKRSPIAEMYVKLSQCNSHSSCLVKGKKEKLTTGDNTVTYRIDLNVNLAGVPASDCHKPKLIKEREIQPLTSDPDEILGKPSNTHISLRPAIR